MTTTVTTTESQPFEPNHGQEIVQGQIARSNTGSDVTTARFPFYIKDRLPNHVVENYDLYVKFIEAYFEWLGISNGIDKIPYLMDLNSISDDLLIHHKELLAELWPENAQFNWSRPEKSIVDLRRFLSFIRQFYLTKGTEESIRFILSSVYDIDSAEIDFDYPKVQLLFLSDSIWVPNLENDTDAIGNPYEGYWKDSRTMLSDGVKFRDKYYQEFSYVIKATTQNDTDKFVLEAVRDIAHPAGFRLFNNVGPDVYIPSAPGPIDTGYVEPMLIGHYLAYQFDTVLNPRDPFNGTCNVFQPGYDWFPCGFNPYTYNPLSVSGSVNCGTAKHDPDGFPIGYTFGAAAGASGYTYTEDTYITANSRGYTLWTVFEHPNTWAIGPTAGTAFGDMKLGWIQALIPDVTKGVNGSPNDPTELLTNCTLA